MAATSLKLPDELKLRVAQLVEGSGKSAHAFMLEAIEQATVREELRRRFGEEAALAESEARKTRQLYDAGEVFQYLEARAKGAHARRPRAKPWRRSA